MTIERRSVCWRIAVIAGAGVVLALPARASAQSACSSESLAVQVLGSGGPNAGGTRASSGYLVCRGGRVV